MLNSGTLVFYNRHFCIFTILARADLETAISTRYSCSPSKFLLSFNVLFIIMHLIFTANFTQHLAVTMATQSFDAFLHHMVKMVKYLHDHECVELKNRHNFDAEREY